MGVDFAMKELIDYKPGINVRYEMVNLVFLLLNRLQLWDIAGQERYKCMTRYIITKL